MIVCIPVCDLCFLWDAKIDANWEGVEPWEGIGSKSIPQEFLLKVEDFYIGYAPSQPKKY
jgi:hypothetical protein